MISFDFLSARAKKARIGWTLRGVAGRVQPVLAGGFVLLGILMLVFGLAGGWFMLGLSALPFMIYQWNVHELRHLPSGNSSTFDQARVLSHMNFVLCFLRGGYYRLITSTDGATVFSALLSIYSAL